MKNFIIFVVFLAVSTTVCSAFSDCGSKNGESIKTTVSGCENPDQTCILHRGTNATLTLEFKTKKEIENVTSLVYGVVLDVPIPFALPNSDGCVDSGLTCPLAADQTYTYTSTLPVEKKYPKMTVGVKWELLDENNEMILCILIPSKIQ